MKIKFIKAPNRLIKDSRSLEDKLPHLVASCWHPDNAYAAYEVTPHSRFNALWRCANDPTHSPFRKRVSDRTASYVHNTKTQCCPTCAKRSGRDTGGHLSEELAREWMYKENGSIPASWVNERSNKLASWRCSADASHRFRTKVCMRALFDQGCPACYQGECKNLQEFRKLSRFFDRTSKNRGYNPQRLPAGHRVFWRCPRYRNHIWYQSFAEMADYGKCPKCHPRRIDLRRHESLLAQFDRRLNAGVDPCMLLKFESVHWRCGKGADHTWTARLYDRMTRQDGCPFCSGRKPSETNSILRYPEIAAEWDSAKNGGQSAGQVRSNSRQRYWWTCSSCSTEWKQSPYSRTGGKNSGQKNCNSCRAMAKTSQSYGSNYAQEALQISAGESLVLGRSG
jgi:hypothetical protein